MSTTAQVRRNGERSSCHTPSKPRPPSITMDPWAKLKTPLAATTSVWWTRRQWRRPPQGRAWPRSPHQRS